MPITPFPTLFTAPVYRGATHSLELTIANFFYEDPRSKGQRSLDIYLGSLGPLNCRIYKAPPPGPLTNVVGMAGGPPQQYIQEVGTDGTPRAEDNAANVFAQDYLVPTVHNIVMVDLPPMEDIIKILEDETPARPNGNHQNGTSPHGSEEPVSSASGKALPLLFIRSFDGVGYHSGRSLQLENVFQQMGDMQRSQAGGFDQAWMAAAQAAATIEGGLHGWTLRVL